MFRKLISQCHLISYRRSGGFGALEAVVSLSVVISLMSLGARYATQYTDDIVNQAAAQQLNQLSQAINHYAHDHFESLIEQTERGQMVWRSEEIKAFLVTNGYLPATLPAHNPYQQSYRVLIQQQSAGKSEKNPEQKLLQLLLLTQAGQEIHESNLLRITQLAGPSSGYISHLDSKQVTGCLKGWQLPQSDGMAIPSPGHLATLNYLHANDVLNASSLLFRKGINNHPEYNRMETSLQMAANIELEDGTKIVFNQKNGHTTVIESGKMELKSNNVSIQLGPEKLIVNTPHGVSGYRGIQTNSHIVAEGDVDAGRNLNAGHNVEASADVKANQDIIAGRNIYAQKLKIGNMELTSDSLKFNGIDLRKDADIPEYHTSHMYGRDSLWQTALNHCRNHWSRLFIVSDGGWARHLVMCLKSPSSNGSDYWIVATGDYRHPQYLNTTRP